MKNYLIFSLFLLLPSMATAECLMGQNGQVSCGAGECKLDSTGKVSCSQFVRGGAGISSTGRVLCGVGECKVNSTGRVICSTVQDGGAAVNQGGSVKCFGGCDQGSEAMCESVPGM